MSNKLIFNYGAVAVDAKGIIIRVNTTLKEKYVSRSNKKIMNVLMFSRHSKSYSDQS